ncbi:DedA family protein [Actinacidiphila acididurans]|uniref:DedA family protein n=1 Tax=Actinacidiphila acididurans TaxID=2784346 RepID=A0ABS2U143_9ACTN|nr:DedA family protein [Actinacidiphila acididurans]MBM9508250.1 DedA family protein [Actinacidiphila acididurans]
MAPHAVLAAGWLDGGSLLSRFGAWAVLVVVFAETGVPVLGALLPGDTLLLPAGLLCAPHALGGVRLSLSVVLLCAAAGSVAGAQTGFLLGRRGARSTAGRRPWAGLERAEAWFERYGPRRAVVLGRFVPVVRTLIHPVAGLLGMPTRSFTLWQAAAGVLWSQSLVLAGYALGATGRSGSTYLVPAVAVAVAAGLAPPAWQWLRTRRATRRKPTTDTPLPPSVPPTPESRCCAR